ncbi:MAG: invasion protein regulator [bacterium ADurb.Bin363]|nr:MAG: invasion protein regulator [bacterium ADurb.Bin363]
MRLVISFFISLFIIYYCNVSHELIISGIFIFALAGLTIVNRILFWKKYKIIALLKNATEYEKNKNIEKVIETCNKIKELNPDKNTWFEMGELLLSIDKEESIKCFDKAIEINPKNAEIYYMKAHTLYLLNRYEEAIKCYNMVLELKPTKAVREEQERIINLMSVKKIKSDNYEDFSL